MFKVIVETRQLVRQLTDALSLRLKNTIVNIKNPGDYRLVAHSPWFLF